MYVFCSPNSSTVVSASLGSSIEGSGSKLGHPPNVVACTRPWSISKAVRVCPHRGCVPSGRVSCGEGRQLTGGCRFKIHSEHTIVQLHRSRKPDLKCRTHSCEFIANSGKTYHCQPVWTNPTAIKFITQSEICTVSVHCNYLG